MRRIIVRPGERRSGGQRRGAGGEMNKDRGAKFSLWFPFIAALIVSALPRRAAVYFYDGYDR